jgi:hypothetical protein
MNDRPIRFKSNYEFCLEAVKQEYLGILKLFYEMQIQQRQNKTEKPWDKKHALLLKEDILRFWNG